MEDQEVQELVSLITDTIKEAVFADDRLTSLVARVDALEAPAVAEVVEAPATEEVEAVEEVVEPTPAEEVEAPKISKLQEIINKIKGVK